MQAKLAHLNHCHCHNTAKPFTRINALCNKENCHAVLKSSGLSMRIDDAITLVPAYTLVNGLAGAIEPAPLPIFTMIPFLWSFMAGNAIRVICKQPAMPNDGDSAADQQAAASKVLAWFTLVMLTSTMSLTCCSVSCSRYSQ